MLREMREEGDDVLAVLLRQDRHSKDCFLRFAIAARPHLIERRVSHASEAEGVRTYTSQTCNRYPSEASNIRSFKNPAIPCEIMQSIRHIPISYAKHD